MIEKSLARPLDPKLIEGRIKATDLDPAVSRRALDYIRGLTSSGVDQPKA